MSHLRGGGRDKKESNGITNNKREGLPQRKGT